MQHDGHGQRVAVVTGTAHGIGLSVTTSLLAQGYRVFAFDRAVTSLPPSEHLQVVQGDATHEDDVARLTDTVGAHGALHVLVNAVGLVSAGRFEALSLADWRQSFEANLGSVVLVTQKLLPLLRQTQDADRVIVSLSSTLARVADPDMIAYSAFKAALESLTRSLALDLAPDGIRVLAVAPGPVSGTAAEERWTEQTYGRLNPLGRFVTPEEVARLVAFLVSPSSAALTGAVYAVDGGEAALGAGWGPLEALMRRGWPADADKTG